LERIIAQNPDSDVTLIGSGVHIIPERYLSYVEEVGQPAKKKILDLILKYEKSGVIFMSGDVHWAQMFKMGCESYTSYDVPEVCSSGLTHVLNENTFEGIDVLMDGHTPLLYKESYIHMNHNFGSFIIRQSQ
jgi:uncharacterized beta-barrel protein YwiB (DUF1934 family)